MNPYLDPEPKPELAMALVFGIAATMISIWLLRRARAAARRRRTVTVIYGGSLIRLRLDDLEREQYRRKFEALAAGKRIAE